MDRFTYTSDQVSGVGDGLEMARQFALRPRSARSFRHFRGVALLLGILATGAFAARDSDLARVTAIGHRALADRAEVERLRQQVEQARGELRLASAHLERWNRIFAFAGEYRIAADLSAAIYDAAVNERIDPELAFPLVQLESQFNERARSPVGALGLTQLMLPTALEFDKTVTSTKLLDRETNLRIGFRYLRHLIKWQKGDVQMALLAYNRGPGTIETARELDLDPSNGYDRIVLKGYRGRGILQ
jgi:soluble lytic murein transglycosylase-like protein